MGHNNLEFRQPTDFSRIWFKIYVSNHMIIHLNIFWFAVGIFFFFFVSLIPVNVRG